MSETDPPVDYLAKYSDKELYELWERRTALLRKSIEESRSSKYIWPTKHDFLQHSIDRVEREMAKRNLPVPGEDTFNG